MLARFACLLLACSSLASAQNRVWVDPVFGDDSTGTNDPDLPFRTITAAATAVEAMFPASERFVLIKPGEYGVSSGEIFPLEPLAGTRLIGLGGSGQTRLYRHNGALVRFAVESGMAPSIAGLQVGGSSSVGNTSQEFGVHYQGLEQLSVTDCALHGLATGVSSPRVAVTDSDFHSVQRGIQTVWGDEMNPIAIERCSFEEFGFAILVHMEGTFDNECLIRDVTFMDGESVFDVLACYSNGARMNLAVERCSITDVNSPFHGGIWALSSSLRFNIKISDSLLAARDSAIHCSQGTTGDVELLRCTVDGLGMSPYPGNDVDELDLIDCISVGHSVDDAGGANAENCYLQSSPSIGTMGNLTAASPGFRSPATGDYRLLWNSVCVDAAGASAIGTDADGLPRNVDGNLDGGAVSDLGAHELQTLALPAEVPLGGSYSIELLGPPGGTYQLLFSRTGLAQQPLATPFGDYYLPPPTSTRLLTGSYNSGTGTQIPLGVPNLASFVGMEFAFQAMAYDSSLPGGAALSQAALMTVTID